MMNFTKLQIPEMPAKPRFMTEAECADLARRVVAMGAGGGGTRVVIESSWTGNIRFGRNQISSSGDVYDDDVSVTRMLNGATATVTLNGTDDAVLHAAVRRAERLRELQAQVSDERLQPHLVDFGEWRKTKRRERGADTDAPPTPEELQSFLADQERAVAMTGLRQTPEEYSRPKLFFESTYGLDAGRRASIVRDLLAPVRAAGMIAAGYIESSASGIAQIDTRGESRYYPITRAQYSVTIRDPEGTGSGWAGVDWNDWDRVDAAKLSAIALDKCLRSRNPVRVEPGRYTAILEPQAVADLSRFVFGQGMLFRNLAENGVGPYAKDERPDHSFTTRLGDRIFDQRFTVTADPMDPDLGFIPFARELGTVYHPATWVDQGVVRNLAYERSYAVVRLGKEAGLPTSNAFRMSGGTATLDDMIAATKRGIYVTRFSNLSVVDQRSMLLSGYTRDGTWLVENGKISKPVKNFRILESPVFVLNNIDALGVPQRVFNPRKLNRIPGLPGRHYDGGEPIVVPALKVRDFHFAGLSDAV